MRMLTSTVSCAVCGQPAVIYLTERPTSDGDGRDFTFQCANRHRALSEAELLVLWAGDQVGRQAAT